MWKIIKLNNLLINQISAWEVVERPVSIVKELVENSIDALATDIKIEIKDWWKTYIWVWDNWEWIWKNDLEICLQKHTTSKIKNVNDLFNIMTFWFRWEALASISSISQFEILTKVNDETHWNKLTFDNINWQNIEKISFEWWTLVIAKNMFYNTPARLNYLKTTKTEYSKILSYLESVSLSYPNIWFEFISDDKKIFKKNINETLKERIYDVYGDDFIDNMLEIDLKTTWIHITWYITTPKISFTNKNKQNLFVNKRPITSFLISKAIFDAYNRFIPHQNQPGYVLNIEVDPTIVDVNVHPRKQEVRFENEQNIFRAVYHAILDNLEKSVLIKDENTSFLKENDTQINSFSQENTFQTKNYYTWSWTKFKSYSPYKDTSPNPNQNNIIDAINFTKSFLNEDETQINNDFENNWDLHYTKLWKIIWQTFNSYIIVEKDKKIIIFDQHALAERIIYEKLVNNEKITSSQKLLFWENIKLLSKEFLIFENYKDIFLDMWFEIEDMWNNIINISSIPDFIKKENLKEIILNIVQDIELWKTKDFKSIDEVKNKIMAYTACRSAIKFWNKLNLFEINKLLNDAFDWYSLTCPHWRPVIFEIDLEELKNKYER